MNSRSLLRPGTPCPDEVQAYIDDWVPHWPKADLKTWAKIAHAVRTWVSYASPQTRGAAKDPLCFASQFVLWAYRSRGSLDPDDVWSKRNVENYVNVVMAAKSDSWRRTCRSRLNALAPLFSPIKGGWPPPAQTLSRERMSPPYSEADELAYREGAKCYSGDARARVLWVVAGSFGAGLRSPDLRRVRTSDVAVSVDDASRIVVNVNGRTVPVRTAYTEMVNEAVRLTPAGGLLLPGGDNITNRTAGYLVVSGLETLKAERARNTWLAKHLRNNTDLLHLMQIAGLTSAETIFRIATQLEPMDSAAARKGALRA